MRYVKLKTVVSRVVDEIIEDPETIQSLLTVLKDKEITCTLRLSNGPKMSGVRINTVNQDNFSFRVINSRSTLKKQSSIADLDFLEVNTSADMLCRTKPEVSRWLLLDPSSDFPE